MTSVQILFIDESGTPPSAKNALRAGYFVLGGVVIPEEVWLKLAGDLKKLTAQYKITGEIKWRHFATPKEGAKSHSLSHLSPEDKNQLRLDLFKALVAFKSVKVISVVTHCSNEYAKGFVKTANAMYWLAYKQLTERFQYYLQDLSKIIGHSVHGIVVIDNRMPADDDTLRKVHARLMGANTDTISRYQNIIEGLFIAPSHMSVGIQFADMVAGAIYRKFKANDTRFYDLIVGSIRTSPAGKVEGFGIVKSPAGTW
jgi:hypothetical protein